MGQHWNYTFTKHRKNGRPFTDPFGFTTAEERLRSILQNKILIAGNKKGKHYQTSTFPHSVSFTALPLEKHYYDDSGATPRRTIWNTHSCFGVAVTEDALPFHTVRYLTSEEERAEHIPPEELWLIDSVTPTYDFSWSEELRVLATNYSLSKGRNIPRKNVPINPEEPIKKRTIDCIPTLRLPEIVFAMVGDEDQVKQFQEEYGVEAYASTTHRKNVSRYIRSHTGNVLPPLETTLHAELEAVKAEREANGVKDDLCLQEALERTWAKLL